MNTNSLKDQTESTQKPRLSQIEIQNWLVNYMAENLDVPPSQVDLKLPFDRYNLDSAVVIGMTGELEILLNTVLDPTIVYDYPTIALLSQQLSSENEIDWKPNLHK